MTTNTAHQSTRVLHNRRSIFVRLFSSFVTSSLLIITVIGFIYYEYARQTIAHRVNEQAQNSLKKSIALFETGFQSPIESQLKLLEGSPSMNNFLTVQKEQAVLVRFDIERQFSQLIQSRPDLYRSIRFVNAFGFEKIHVDAHKRHRQYQSIVADTDKNKVQPQLKALFEFFKDSSPRQIAFSQPFQVDDGRFLFYAGISKMEPEISGVGGAIIIECDLTPFIKSLSEIQSHGYAIAWLLSSQGEIITRPSNSQELPQNLFNDSNPELNPESNKVIWHHLYPGDKLSEQQFLSIVLQIPNEIFKHQNLTILKTVLFIALLAIVFTFIVAWLVSRRITKPIIELVQASHQLALGDYTTRSNLKDKSEVGELSRSFNHMAETLEQSIQSLDNQLTSRIAAEHALQQSHESLQLILNSTAEGLFGIDLKGYCTFCNPSALEILGYHQEQELIAQDMHEILALRDEKEQLVSKDNSRIFKAMELQQTVHSDAEFFLTADKKKIAIEYRAHPVIQDYQVVGAVVSFNDITERKQKDNKIVYQAHYDMLTGLPNRFLAMDRLEQMIRNAERQNNIASVLFIDLDGFKKVNDMLGHEMGDKVLVESAIRLRDCLRAQDTVGRLGGDEFIVLLPDIKQQLDIRFVVESILEVFRHPFNIEGHELILTASIGIASYPDDSQLGVKLLRNADIAMYESKQSGRNTYHFFSHELNAGIQRRLEVEEQLHYALVRGEFNLVYQPIIDIQAMQVSGAEVLLRWNNKKLGVITPDEFIPITEHTGSINEIGQFILKQSIEQMAQWQNNYSKSLKISVNVSPRQLHDKSLLDNIDHYLKTNEVSGHSLQLELTEGVLMSKNTAIMQMLALMRDSQIHIAMDDFGTGYSSLSYLRKYPFNSLKIDRTFIRDIHNDNIDKTLVNATLEMSHTLGVKVVAEGIETREQLEFLTQAGCEYGQGYYFSKPLSAEEFEQQFLKTNPFNQARKV